MMYQWTERERNDATKLSDKKAREALPQVVELLRLLHPNDRLRVIEGASAFYGVPVRIGNEGQDEECLRRPDDGE